MFKDLEDFRQWLVVKEPDDAVGRVCDDHHAQAQPPHWVDCPIEQFAKEELGVPVRASRWSMWVGDSHEIGSPAWVSAFTHRIDDLLLAQGQPTAKDALTILDDVLLGENGTSTGKESE